MAAAYDRLVNQIRATIPGITDDLVENQLGWTLLDFTNSSNCWVAPLAFNTVVGVQVYELETSALQGRVNRLMNVVGADALPVEAYLSPSADELDIDTVSLAAPASMVRSLTANFGLIPYMSDGLVNTIPEWVWDKYGPKIYSGALARIMAMPAKPWTNPALAGGYQQDYIVGRSTATSEALARYSFRRQDWSFPSGWR